jgi:hypothetical protein
MQVSDSLDATFLVPFADFVNHGEDRTRFGLFNVQLELENFANKQETQRTEKKCSELLDLDVQNLVSQEVSQD